MENATSFGRQAEVYFAARPTYPDELFRWISEESPNQELAWDVGTGSGQAALKLTDYFTHVHATDIDKEQVSQAPGHPQVTFTDAPAHLSSLQTGSVDAITVATALHWFDHELFWKEVRRVARDDAIFCAWTYHSAETDKEVQNKLIDPVAEVLEPYWSDGNRLSWRGYSRDELKMPFEVVSVPKFSCDLEWSPLQIATFVRSWSAHQKARLDGHSETLDKIEQQALAKLGSEPRRFVLPMHFLAARIR